MKRLLGFTIYGLYWGTVLVISMPLAYGFLGVTPKDWWEMRPRWHQFAR